MYVRPFNESDRDRYLSKRINCYKVNIYKLNRYIITIILTDGKRKINVNILYCFSAILTLI